MTTQILRPDHTTRQDPVAQVVEVSKTYGRGVQAVHALCNVTASFAHGSFTAIMGPSGSGKSTLLHVAAGLDRPSSGVVKIGDADLACMSEKGLTRLRRDRIGFVFQAYNLIPSLDVAQNITLPGRLAGTRVDRAWLAEVGERVGLGDRRRRRARGRPGATDGCGATSCSVGPASSGPGVVSARTRGSGSGAVLQRGRASRPRAGRRPGLEGDLVFWLGDDEIEAPPGTYAYIPPGVRHGFRCNSPVGRVYNTLTPGGFDDFLQGHATPAPRIEMPPPGVSAIDVWRELDQQRPRAPWETEEFDLSRLTQM